MTTLSADFADLFFAGNTYHIPNSDYIALTPSQQQELDDQSNVIIDVPMGECDLETGCGGHCEGDDWYFTSCQLIDGVPTCVPDTNPTLNSSNCASDTGGDYTGDDTGTGSGGDTSAFDPSSYSCYSDCEDAWNRGDISLMDEMACVDHFDPYNDGTGTDTDTGTGEDADAGMSGGAMGILGLIALAYLLLKRKQK